MDLIIGLPEETTEEILDTLAQLDEKDNNFKTFLKEFLETKYYTPPNKSSLKENDFD